jgi:hypothetical protein
MSVNRPTEYSNFDRFGNLCGIHRFHGPLDQCCSHHENQGNELRHIAVLLQAYWTQCTVSMARLLTRVILTLGAGSAVFYTATSEYTRPQRVGKTFALEYGSHDKLPPQILTITVEARYVCVAWRATLVS